MANQGGGWSVPTPLTPVTVTLWAQCIPTKLVLSVLCIYHRMSVYIYYVHLPNAGYVQHLLFPFPFCHTTLLLLLLFLILLFLFHPCAPCSSSAFTRSVPFPQCTALSPFVPFYAILVESHLLFLHPSCVVVSFWRDSISSPGLEYGQCMRCFVNTEKGSCVVEVHKNRGALFFFIKISICLQIPEAIESG